MLMIFGFLDVSMTPQTNYFKRWVHSNTPRATVAMYSERGGGEKKRGKKGARRREAGGGNCMKARLESVIKCIRALVLCVTKYSPRPRVKAQNNMRYQASGHSMLELG